MKIKALIISLFLVLVVTTSSWAYRDYYGLATARDGNGNIIPYATVSVYLAGTTSPATIYDSSTSTTTLTSTTTNVKGVYGFYVDRLQYGASQAFKVVVSKLGWPTFTNDNVVVNQTILKTYTITTPITLSHSLRIPRGVKYILASDFIIDASVNLECEDRNDNFLSTHVYADGSTNPIIYIPPTSHGASIRNCMVGYVTDPSYNQGYIVGAPSDKVSPIVVGSLSASATVNDVTLEDVYIKGSLLHGISLCVVNNARIIRPTIMNVTGTGIQGFWVYNSIIDTPYIENSRDNAISIEARTSTQTDYANYSKNNLIINPIIEGPQEGGIHLNTTIGTVISNAMINNTNNTPIASSSLHNSAATSWPSMKTSIIGGIITNAFGNYGAGKKYASDVYTTSGGSYGCIEANHNNADGSGNFIATGIQCDLAIGGTGYNGVLIKSVGGGKISDSTFQGKGASPNRMIYGVAIGTDASSNALDFTVSNVTVKHATIGYASIYSSGVAIKNNLAIDTNYPFESANNSGIDWSGNNFKTTATGVYYLMTGDSSRNISRNVDLDASNNYTGTVACVSPNTSTTVSNKQVTANSVINFWPANAGAAAGVASTYYSDLVVGASWKLNHPACTSSQQWNYEIIN